MRESSEKILCPLRAAALATPDATAILDTRRAVSYAELDQMVSATAARLLETGCDSGARVALYLPRDERYIVLLLALLRAKCVSVPLNTRLPPQGTYPLLRRAGCSMLVSEDEKLLESIPPEVRGLRPGALISGADGETGTACLDLDLAATVVFTSGSTGVPKAALHTFGNHYHSALGSNANITLSLGDRWLLSLPLYHVGGLSIVFRCLLASATIALPGPEAPLDQSIVDLGATHVSLVATQLQRLLQKNTKTGGLKAALLGGGPAPETLLREAVAEGVPIHTSYGLTEMASQVTATPPGATPEELRTSGETLAYREVSLSGGGEVLVRGKTLFAGYAEGDEVDRPLDADGWFHTGDLGEFDDKGNLRIRGRLDNLFISGGENIQPEEIEAALERIEDVERAIVVPVSDREFGERPVAFVQARGGLIPRNLADKLGEILPRFKLPVAFYEWPEDASTGAMKPDRESFRGRASRLHREA